MKTTNGAKLGELLQISPARGIQAKLKAQLIGAILKEVSRQQITHAELSLRSGIPRSAVTGILSGSLQKITLDRLFRLLEAVKLRAEIKIKKAA